MSLCSTCQAIDFLSIPRLPSSYNGLSAKNKSPNLVYVSKRRKAEEGQAEVVDETLGQPFHQSLEALQETAAECAVCKVVAQDIARLQDELAKTELDSWTKGPEWKIWLATGPNDISGFMVVAPDKGDSNFLWIVSAVGLCTDDDDPLGSVVTGRTIEVNPTSESTVQRALRWIQQDTQSIDNHPLVSQTFLPAKLLDVNSSFVSEVSFSSLHEQGTKYAALSHPSDAMLDTRVVATRDSKDTNALPKVFQDAITMTRKLGLQYLWIDILCTRYDDDFDSYRSSPEFASIYANAYITLSTTGCSSDIEGMLTERSPPTYFPFSYSHKTMNGTIYAFSLPKEPTLYPSNDRIMSDQPLSQHGWALQERLFSSRVLHFSTTQMYFESDTHFLSEDGFKMSGRHDTFTPVSAHTWQNILGLYCRRTLPKPSDKLPAIANIARSIAAQTGHTYLAGLWREKLTEGLIWQAIGHARGATSEPPTYRAPSWSWASIDGPFGSFALGSGWDVGDFEDVVQILDVKVVTKANDLYGEVRDAWIKMRAPLEALTPVEEAPRKQVWKMKTGNGDEDGTSCIFDTVARAEKARGVALYAILLTKRVGRRGGDSSGSERSYYHGIVVAPVEGKDGAYERLGKVVLSDEVLGKCGWMEDKGELREVVLA